MKKVLLIAFCAVIAMLVLSFLHWSAREKGKFQLDHDKEFTARLKKSLETQKVILLREFYPEPWDTVCPFFGDSDSSLDLERFIPDTDISSWAIHPEDNVVYENYWGLVFIDHQRKSANVFQVYKMDFLNLYSETEGCVYREKALLELRPSDKGIPPALLFKALPITKNGH